MRRPQGLVIKEDSETCNKVASSIELSSFIDPSLGLRIDQDTFLSDRWEGKKGAEKQLNEFLKLDFLGKGCYASVYKVYHRPTNQLMV